MKPVNLLFLFLIAGFLSCKKDGNAPETVITGIYHSAKKASVNEAVMYTSAGVINDQNAIKSYLSRRGNLNEFVFNSNQADVQDTIWLQFLQGDTVNVGYGASGYTACRLVEKNNSDIVFANRDTSRGLLDMNFPLSCDSLNRMIRKVASPTLISWVAGQVGYMGYMKKVETHLAEVKNGQLSLPIMTYVTWRNGPNRNCIMPSSSYNRPIENVPALLQPGDTIVCQVREIPMLK